MQYNGNDLNLKQVKAPLTLRYMYGTFPEMYNVFTHECFIIVKKSQVWLTVAENRLLYKITYKRNGVFAIFLHLEYTIANQRRHMSQL